MDIDGEVKEKCTRAFEQHRSLCIWMLDHTGIYEHKALTMLLVDGKVNAWQRTMLRKTLFKMPAGLRIELATLLNDAKG